MPLNVDVFHRAATATVECLRIIRSKWRWMRPRTCIRCAAKAYRDDKCRLICKTQIALWQERCIGVVVSLGCGITQAEHEHKGGKGGGVASQVRKAVSQLTSTEPAHRKVLEDLRVTSSAGSASNMSVQSQPRADQIPASTYGGYSSNPRNHKFAQCLYVRLNPPLARDVPLDTKDEEDVAMLRSSTESWLDEKETLGALTRLFETLHELESRTEAAGTMHNAEEGVPPTSEPEPEPASGSLVD